MVFTSHIFVFYFLPLAVLTYYAIPQRSRNLFLLFASYVFYAWWRPSFVLLMLVSTVIDYSCGRVLTRIGATAPQRRAALVTSLIANLSLLGVFKYATFFAHNINGLLTAAGGQALSVPDIVLPIGISFYTFQSMSYTIDLYRGDARPARSFVDFATYVSLFPQLIAGPIVRYRQIADQLHERNCTLGRVARGLSFFALGFAKKLIIANNVGLVADAAFSAAAPPWHVAWIGVIAYAFQIYYDFSGYSDMAIGLGLVFGFKFPENFNQPYRAESITDFWHRWHISLSTWLRDYLYIPLGGNRRGPSRTYVNLALVMLLGGLWHGAQWQFVVWGGIHGALLALERALGKRSLYAWLPRPGRIAVTFVLVLVTWVFFRADGLGHALRYLGAMGGIIAPASGSALAAALMYGRFEIVMLSLTALITWLAPRTDQIVDFSEGVSPFRMVAAVGMVTVFVVAILEMTVQSYNPFLYFRF